MVLGIPFIFVEHCPFMSWFWLPGSSLGWETYYSSHFTEAKLRFPVKHKDSHNGGAWNSASLQRLAYTVKQLTVATAIPMISGQTTQTIRSGQCQKISGGGGSKALCSLPGPHPEPHPLAFSPGLKARWLVSPMNTASDRPDEPTASSSHCSYKWLTKLPTIEYAFH